MVVSWEWDDTLFSGAAPYYQRGRLPYAPGWIDTLAEALTLDGQGRLLDIGCGPGTLALSLADHFSETVGVDPDRGMIAEATQLAEDAGLTQKTRWIQARAEELPADLGMFTVASFGNSFHWMDRDLVAATVKELLQPTGAVVHIADLKTETRTVEGLPHPAVPYPAIQDLVEHYLGPVRRAGRGILPNGTPGDEAAVFNRAGFADRERYVLPGGQALVRTADEVVALVFSTSSSAPHLFGVQRNVFEADLRQLLAETSPTNRFSERQPSTEIFIWRKR